MHANNQITFSDSMIQRKMEFHSLHMHQFSISTFQNEIQIAIEFNECADIHGHIHTQCTLASISGYHFLG